MPAKRRQPDPTPEFDLGLPPAPRPSNHDLSIKPGGDQATLSPAQIEFNKRLKALEKARAEQDRARKKLDADLIAARTELMPLYEKRVRANYQLAGLTHHSLASIKLSANHRESIQELLEENIFSLLDDPVGLNDAEIEELRVIAQLDSDDEDKPSDSAAPDPDGAAEAFENLRDMVGDFERLTGVKINLDGLDPTGDPAVFEEELAKRLEDAQRGFETGRLGHKPKARRKRKPSAAALERERLREQVEAAKNRDLKSLYKQLAKVLHPDLESDPALKLHKEAWMKRLTSAHGSGDLREMLAIELEWLGEEAGNLARASDEKLRIYSLVLNEQIDEVKEKTRWLIMETEYAPLQRFIQPFSNRLDVRSAKARFIEQLHDLEHMISILQKGGAPARRMLQDWAVSYDSDVF